jgi:hypothetical protein
MEVSTMTAMRDSGEVFNPADFSRKSLVMIQRKATGLLESGILLPDERSCAERIAHRCAGFLGEKRSARASIGNITEAEIEEWKNSGITGQRLAGWMAEFIRNGAYYESGGPIFAPDCQAQSEVSRESVEDAMALLVEQKVVRRSGRAWYVNEESVHDMPEAARTLSLDAQKGGGAAAGLAAIKRPARPARPLHAVGSA